MSLTSAGHVSPSIRGCRIGCLNILQPLALIFILLDFPGFFIGNNSGFQSALGRSLQDGGDIDSSPGFCGSGDPSDPPADCGCGDDEESDPCADNVLSHSSLVIE